MIVSPPVVRSAQPRMLEEPKQGINEPFTGFQRRHYTWRTDNSNPFQSQIPKNEGLPTAKNVLAIAAEVLLSTVFGGPLAEYETDAAALPFVPARAPKPFVRGQVKEQIPLQPVTASALKPSVTPEPVLSDLGEFAIRWYSGRPTEASDMANLTRLQQESNVPELPAVEGYIEAGSSFINNDLRYGDGQNPHTLEFLKEFKSLEKYDGCSYRAATVSPETRLALKDGVDQVFSDPGVQSASVVEQHARGWFDDWAVKKQTRNANEPVVFVFDETVPQKNLSNHFLMDHVAVPPGERLVIMNTEERGGVLFVHFGGVKEYAGTPIRIDTGGQEHVQ